MKKSILIIFVIITLIALPISLAFSKGGYKFVPKTKDIDIFTEIQKSYNNDGNIEISDELVNKVLGQIFEKSINKDSLAILDGYFYVDGENINLCLKSSYKGKTFYPNISAKLEYKEDGLSIYINKFKIGYLTLPTSILIDSMKRYSNDDFKVIDDKILISSHYIPFNVNNIYIKDKKIVIELNKNFKISNDDGKTKDNTGETLKNDTDKNNKNARNNIITKNSTLQNNKPNVNSTLDESKKLLSLVRSQLNGAISSAKTLKEKQILQTIQNVVGEVYKNPSYPYKEKAMKVISDYKSLSLEEKERVKKAIINNVDTKNVIKLISIFGL